MCFYYLKVKKTFSNHFCYFYKVTGHALLISKSFAKWNY